VGKGVFFGDFQSGVLCVLGAVGQIYVGRRLRIPAVLNYVSTIILLAAYFLIGENMTPFWRRIPPPIRSAVPALLLVWFASLFSVAILVLIREQFLKRARRPGLEAGRRDFLRTSTAALCAAPALVLGAGVITRKDVHVREMDLPFPDLPQDLHGLKVLQLSDIHIGPFFTAKDLARVVDASNSLRPDVAVVTGDLITTRWDPLDQCVRELGRLRANSGVWGCMGNHEAYTDMEDETQLKASALGIRFLRYEAALLKFGKSSLNLVGVDYEPFHSKYLANVDHLIAPGSFNLLLSHNPDVFPVAKDKGFDLTLSGHTHGGQIDFEILNQDLNVTRFLTPYTKGLYELAASSIYVNSGLGTIGMPVRLGAPPEISVVRLVRGNRAKG
jgi:predicted MPP superfamily phosphohydrolase